MESLSIWYYVAIIVVLALASFVIYSTFKLRQNNDLKGIYGWLLFFVIKLSLVVIVAPAGVYSEYYKAYAENPELKNLVEFQNLYKISQMIAWLQSLISLYMIYILKTKKIAGTIKTVVIGVWALGLGSNVLLTLSVYLITPNLAVHMTYFFLNSIIQGLIYSVIWSLYFKRSRRVKNTYPSLIVESPSASYGEATTFIDNEVRDYTKL